MKRAAVALIACAMMTVACTSAGPGGRGPRAGHEPAAGALLGSPGRLVDRPVASTGCGHRPAIRPGTTALATVAVPPSNAAGAGRRQYTLHVPLRYDPSRLTPLLLAFHGGGGTGLQMERSSGLSAQADQSGFLVAYPQGLRQGHGRYPPGWDSSGPKDPDADGIDDGLFVNDVLTAIQAGYCVDPARIWATGMSNGGTRTAGSRCSAWTPACRWAG